MRNRIQCTIDANQQMRMGGNQNDETGLWSLNQSINEQNTNKKHQADHRCTMHMNHSKKYMTKNGVREEKKDHHQNQSHTHLLQDTPMVLDECVEGGMGGG